MTQGISIVVCCYNSRFRLEPTLTHLARLKREEILVEVILVDNQSTDDTAQFGQKVWAELGQPFPMILVTEQKQGLSFARQAGVSNSSFDLIVFCDDDNWLDANYLMEAKTIMDSKVNVAALGGYGIAAAEMELPDWFETYKGGYAISDDSVKSGILPEETYLTGAGLVFRKALYLKSFENLPSLLTDRAGSQLSSGGDTEICLRFRLMGYDLWFDKRLKFQHFVPKERLTEAYRDRLFDGFKTHAATIEYYQKLLWAKNTNGLIKIKTVLLIVFKLPFTSLRLIKRWNLERDLTTLYVLVGINFIKLPVPWIQLYNLSKSKPF